MAKLTNIFVLVLLITVTWMPIRSEVDNGDEIRTCEDTWYDKDCDVNDSVADCGTDCIAKYSDRESDVLLAYCKGSNCTCLYRCD